MKAVRAVYRAKLVEPVLVVLLFFQVGTGLYFAFRYMAKPMDAFRAFQVASGMYLVFYVIGHMDFVFILGRTFLGIETGWDFATGAPVGLIKGARNIRLRAALWARRVLRDRPSVLRIAHRATRARRIEADSQTA